MLTANVPSAKYLINECFPVHSPPIHKIEYGI